jgi:hypothetical protein
MMDGGIAAARRRSASRAVRLLNGFFTVILNIQF